MTMNRNFLLLWQGFVTSSLGTHLFNMAGVLWLVDVVNSASLVGLLMLAYGLPVAMFTPLGGVLADRVSRRNILVTADLFNSLALLGLASLFFLADTLPILIIGLFITQIILGACSGFFMPTVVSLLPDILPGDELANGNAVINITNSVTQVVGRGCTGMLFVLLGAPVLLLVIGVCFLLSALSELFIRLPASSKPPTSEEFKTTSDVENVTSTISIIVLDIKEGINYILADKGVTKAFLLQAGLMWCLSTLMVNTPFLVQYHFDQTSDWYGYLLASLSTGLIVGSICAAKQFNKLTILGSRTNLLKFAAVTAPLFCMGVILTKSVYPAMLLFFLQGFSQSIAYITTTTQIQVTTPKRLQGRVVSVITLISTIVFAISGFAVGVSIDMMGKDVVLVQWLLSVIGCLFIYPLLVSKNLFHFIRYSPEKNLQESNQHTV